LVFVAEDSTAKSLQQCESLALKLNNVSQLPKGCEKYGTVVQSLEKKMAEQQGSLTRAFTGMSPGQAQRAKVNRLKGIETQAQFQRRMTRSHKMSRD
jgi:hypothetical protein